MGFRYPYQKTRRRSLSGKAGMVLLAAGCGVVALLTAQPVHAQNVTAVFSQSGGFFNYNFTVINNTSVTLADVNIETGGRTISNLSAPTGFQITYDPDGLGQGQGVVDFLTTDGTRDFFANSRVSGFLLRSSSNLNGITFNTLNVNGASTSGTVVAVAAPEPGTLGLLAFGAAPLTGALVAFRRRFVSSAPLKG